MVYAAFILAAYLMGSIPVGVLLAKLKGKDPRKTGSGNIGATNVMRSAGKALGIITLIGDAAKGFIPVMAGLLYSQDAWLVASIGAAAFLGHLFPVFLNFKGGKGIATSVGVFLALCPVAVAVVFGLFVLILALFRYVSLGSLVGAAFLPATLYFLNARDEYVYLACFAGIMVFLKHHENIKRLLSGTENRISFSTKK